MHTVVIVLLSLVAIIVLLLVLALFMRKDYFVQSEVVIDVPSQKVFDYIKQIRSQDNFNKWILRDPDMTRTFTGTDGTVGFIYAWKDNKGSGEGAQEITGLVEGSRVEIELRFIKPMVAVGQGVMATEPLSA